MKKNNNLYVDIHVLQTVPPSCVNRDDTGTPKQCVFGGVRRACVSSQSWKRAVRLAFREMYAPEELASRTKNIVEMVAKKINAMDESLDASKLAAKALEAAGLSINKKDPKKGTDALFFMSEAQAKALADIIIDSQEEGLNKDACKEALKINPSIDMALFGRMVASDPSLNYDAAAMVAHAISTHKVQTEFDYFTAVDDLSPEDTSGAGHLGTVEYNSSTLYRYASVNVRELAESLWADTPEAVTNFIEAFLLSMPTGKMATFANRSIPNAVYVTIRTDQPVNMAAAFEKPVSIDENGGYIKGSERALAEYAESAYTMFVEKPEKCWVVGDGLSALGNAVSLKDMLFEISSYLEGALTEDR